MEAMLSTAPRPRSTMGPSAAEQRRSTASDVDLHLLLLPVHRQLVERTVGAEAGVVDQQVHRTGPVRQPSLHRVRGTPGADRSATSTSTVTPWAAVSSPASACSRSSSRATTTRSVPSAARRRAMASPMPLDAPVTRAVDHRGAGMAGTYRGAVQRVRTASPPMTTNPWRVRNPVPASSSAGDAPSPRPARRPPSTTPPTGAHRHPGRGRPAARRRRPARRPVRTGGPRPRPSVHRRGRRPPPPPPPAAGDRPRRPRGGSGSTPHGAATSSRTMATVRRASSSPPRPTTAGPPSGSSATGTQCTEPSSRRRCSIRCTAVTVQRASTPTRTSTAAGMRSGRVGLGQGDVGGERPLVGTVQRRTVDPVPQPGQRVQGRRARRRRPGAGSGCPG